MSSFLFRFFLLASVLGCLPSSDQPNHSPIVDKAANAEFRFLRPEDLCASVAVYSAPKEDSKVGRLVEEYERYRDPASGRVVNAVMVSALVDHHVKGIWKSKKQLSRLYIRSDDGNLTPCSWSVRKEEISPLPNDEVPLILDPGD